MSIREIAEQVFQTGRLNHTQEGELYQLFEKCQADESDMQAADQLIHALLDGEVVREWGPPYECNPYRMA
ncbi:MAG: hypothetical protein NW237_01675 [Cyanobacteriota bacterium]|nr:hypothetical protein [Cyanobacteriota bacterium]